MDFDLATWLPYILGAIIIAAVAFSIIVAFTTPSGVVKLQRAPRDEDGSNSGLILGQSGDPRIVGLSVRFSS